MVFGMTPECLNCKSSESCMWQKTECGQILCQECHKLNISKPGDVTNSDKEKPPSTIDTDNEDKREDGTQNKTIKDEDEENDKEKDNSKNLDKKESKKKTRKGRQGGKGSIPKGKGRRFIFKKSATKAPVAVSTPVTSAYLFYEGNYYQVGDVVSVIDVEGGTYYAQIRGLLQDQYCEKSAVITWLLPSKNSPSPEEKFDPSTYIIGPEEDVPRKLEYLRFVCHAPSDYFKDKSSPYATVYYKPQSCYVWSKMGPVIKPIDNTKEYCIK